MLQNKRDLVISFLFNVHVPCATRGLVRNLCHLYPQNLRDVPARVFILWRHHHSSQEDFWSMFLLQVFCQTGDELALRSGRPPPPEDDGGHNQPPGVKGQAFPAAPLCSTTVFLILLPCSLRLIFVGFFYQQRERWVQLRRLHREGGLLLSKHLLSNLYNVCSVRDVKSVCGSFSLCLTFFPLPPSTLIYSVLSPHFSTHTSFPVYDESITLWISPLSLLHYLQVM